MLITERIFTNDFHPVSIVFFRCLFGMILEEKVNGGILFGLLFVYMNKILIKWGANEHGRVTRNRCKYHGQ
jgi:hypothetical protein